MRSPIFEPAGQSAALSAEASVETLACWGCPYGFGFVLLMELLGLDILRRL